jgi:cytoskeleton-associated protein 5
MLQLGHNIEKVREKMRELAKQILHAYSATKSFPYILEGLRSKNNRTRIECADLVGFLIDQHGAEVQLDNLCCCSYWLVLLVLTSLHPYFIALQISGQLKSLQIVASLTAERDGEIRKAALNALATGYKILGMF